MQSFEELASIHRICKISVSEANHVEILQPGIEVTETFVDATHKASMMFLATVCTQ